jgi:hypothetical protein
MMRQSSKINQSVREMKEFQREVMRIEIKEQSRESRM